MNVFLLFYLFWVYLYINTFLTSEMFFFYDHFWFAVTDAIAGSLQRGRPKSQSQSQSGGDSKPQERGRGGCHSAIPKRDLWLVVFVACIFLCVFFLLVKLFDLECLKTQLDESSCWGLFFLSTLVGSEIPCWRGRHDLKSTNWHDIYRTNDV